MASKSFFAALFLLVGVVSAQTYTFQTSPSSSEILTTAAGLVVRWENRPGNSPDSATVVTPAQVSVFLGYRDGQNPKILFPALNGLTSNVPTAGGSYVWQKMDFTGFQNGPAPPRDMNTEWFIQISDQSTGYKSNGQLFKIIDAPGGSPPPNASAPGNAAPTSAAPPPANGNPQPTNAAPSQSKPNDTKPTAPVPSGTNRPTNTPASGATSVAATVGLLVMPLVVSQVLSVLC